MNEITTSKGSFIFVEVPKESKSFEVKNNWLYYYSIRLNGTAGVVLPSITYTFLCTTYTITDDVAKSIVDRDECGFIVNYVDLSDCCETYLDSFKTLLQLLNLSPNKNYAICKKN